MSVKQAWIAVWHSAKGVSVQSATRGIGCICMPDSDACCHAGVWMLHMQDWEKVAYDLQNLGFIPPEVGDDVLQEMAAPLGRILSQLSGGGGATKLNIDAGAAVSAQQSGCPTCTAKAPTGNNMHEMMGQPACLVVPLNPGYSSCMRSQLQLAGLTQHVLVACVE